MCGDYKIMVVQIAVRYCATKNKTIKRFLIDPEADVADLQEKLRLEFGVPVTEQILRFKAHNFEVRVIAGFPSEFYEIGNNAMVDMYKIESAQDTEAAETADGPQDPASLAEEEDYSENIRLLNKLKFAKNMQNYQMNEIEEEEAEEDDTEKQINALKTAFWEITSTKNRKAFEQFHRQFMDTIDRPSQVLVLQAPDKVGWTGIHYAVRDNEEWAILPLIENFSDEILSIQSDDGWTPLLLAVQNRNWGVLEKLLEFSTRSHLEVITSKGSVLHAIFKNCEFRIIEKLVSVKKVDPFFRDKNEVRAIDLLKPEHQRHVQTLLKLEELPPKPVNLFFEATKKSMFFGRVTRYLYINAEARSFERYKEKESFPFHPREVVPLHMIENLKASGRFVPSGQDNPSNLIFDRRTGQVVEESPFDKHQNFIEFSHNNEQHSYQIQNETHAKLVFKTLTAAIAWSKFYELFVAKLRGAEYESAIAVWKRAAVDFSTFDLLDPIQFTNLLLMERREEGPKSETQPQIFHGLRHFHILKLLGKGAFGKVFKVLHKKSQKIFAMKVLSKRNLLRENQIKYCMIEKEILQNNPQDSFLLSLHFAFQTVENLFMVIDFCPNEDFAVLLNKQEGQRLDEDTVRFFIAEIFLAINELHKRNYIYRDLKPENMLLDEQGHLKLGDFGLAAKNIKNANDFAKSFCGSPMYIAPEILMYKKAYKITDYYSVGVVMFEMLTGETPYYAETQEKLYSLIRKGDYRFPPSVSISDEAKDLLVSLICMPKKRLGNVNGFEDIKRHPFFAPVDWIKLQSKQLQPPLSFPPVVHNFNRPIKLKDTEYIDGGSRPQYIPNFDFVRPEYLDS